MLLNYKKLHDPVTESEINALYCMLRKHTRYYEKVNLNEHGEYGFYSIEEDMLKISNALPTAQYNITFDNDVTVSGIVDDNGILDIPLTDYSISMQVNISFPQHIVTIVPDYNIVLSADKTSMYSDESCTLTGVLTKEGEAWSGQSVALYQSDVLVDTLVTGADGSVSFVVGGLSSGEYVFKAVVGSVESNIVSVAVLYHSYDLELSCSTPIIQKTETAVVNALLSIDGSAYSSQSLSYTVKHGSTVLDSGSVTTDLNGQATISYVGTGVGDVSVEVTYGTLLQKTFVVEDCIFYSKDGTGLQGTYTTSSDATYSYITNIKDDVKFPTLTYPTNFVFSMKHYAGGTDSWGNALWLIGSDASNGLLIGAERNNCRLRIYNWNNASASVQQTRNDSFSANTWYDLEIEYNNGVWTDKANGYSISYSKSFTPTIIKIYSENRYSRLCEIKIKALPEKEPDNLTLSSATPIIQKDDTATINATLTHNDVAVSGKTLNYVVKHGDSILDSGSVVTGSDGTASISYTGTGVGDVSVEVSYGTLLQKTYIVYDVLWKQKCTANDTDAFSNQYGTITDNGETLTLSCSSSNNSFIWLDKAGSSSSAGDGDYTGDYVFECEVTSVTNYSRMMAYAPISGTGSQSFQLSVGKCKMVKQGNTYSYFINDVEQQISPVTKSIDSPYRIGFGVNNGASVTLKNIKLKAL